jgi:ribonuclease G
MTKEIIVNSSPFMTRVAILEDGELSEILVEEKEKKSIVGNIYKGRVNRVLPGMRSAFVDIGLAKDAFLYVTDVTETLADYDLGEPVEKGERRKRRSSRNRSLSIAELLKQGQEILVQVAKEPIGNKGARITAYLTLAGKYLVLMPAINNLGVSRKIKSAEERARLRKLLSRTKKRGFGLIVRTAGEGKEMSHFKPDFKYLFNTWEGISKNSRKAKPPALLYREPDLFLKVLRDLFSPDFSALMVDTEEDYQRAVAFLEQFQPQLIPRVKLYIRERPIFEELGVELQLEKTFENRVWLKSGGYIVINETEALVAIDVNTGKYVGKTDLEDTVFRTNLEAAREVGRQLRLRDLGGIVVVDFIDMKKKENQREVLKVLEAELARDRSQSRLLSLKEFGLVAITRKRVRESLGQLLCQPCPHCHGLGRIKAVNLICHQILTELTKVKGRLSADTLIIRGHPSVISYLKERRERVLSSLEATLKAEIVLKEDPALHEEQFDILPTRSGARFI